MGRQRKLLAVAALLGAAVIGTAACAGGSRSEADILPASPARLRLREPCPAGDPGRTGSLGQRAPPRHRRALLPGCPFPPEAAAAGRPAADGPAADRLRHLLPHVRPAGRRGRPRPDRAPPRRRQRARLGSRRRPEARARRRRRRARALRVLPRAPLDAAAVRRLLPDPGDGVHRQERRALPAGVVRRPSCRRPARSPASLRLDVDVPEGAAAEKVRFTPSGNGDDIPTLLQRRRAPHGLDSRVRRGRLENDSRRAADPSHGDHAADPRRPQLRAGPPLGHGLLGRSPRRRRDVRRARAVGGRRRAQPPDPEPADDVALQPRQRVRGVRVPGEPGERDRPGRVRLR